MIRAALVLLLLAVPLSAQEAMRTWEVEARQPTTMHSYIYGMMEECLDRTGDFDGLRWYVADFILRSDMARLAGLWVSNPRSILLARERWGDPQAVSHEAIHDITNGDLAHEDPLFAECEIQSLE